MQLTTQPVNETNWFLFCLKRNPFQISIIFVITNVRIAYYQKHIDRNQYRFLNRYLVSRTVERSNWKNVEPWSSRKGRGIDDRGVGVKKKKERKKILIRRSVCGPGNIDRTIWVKGCMHLVERIRDRVQRECVGISFVQRHKHTWEVSRARWLPHAIRANKGE